MAKAIVNEYQPDRVTVPGETLQEILDDRQMTQADLADRLGKARKTISEIVHGKAAITPETALQLERVLNIPASFWNRLEQNYREFEARKAEDERLEEAEDWLTKIPVSAMCEHGWIEKHSEPVDQVRELLNFFGVASPDRWKEVFEIPQASFRHSQSFSSEAGALAAWLRRGVILAEGIDCAPYDQNELRNLLSDMRALTNAPPEGFLDPLVELCAQAGVAVVLVPELPQCRLHGATRWLSPQKALVQLSLRYKWADIFWFSFFHEVGHLLLHGKKQVFIEDFDNGYPDSAQKQEEEANSFAARTLVPPGELRAFKRSEKKGYVSEKAVRQFARSIGVHPGVVVGRLHHEGWLPRTHLNKLRCRLELMQASTGRE